MLHRSWDISSKYKDSFNIFKQENNEIRPGYYKFHSQVRLKDYKELKMEEEKCYVQMRKDEGLH